MSSSSNQDNSYTPQIAALDYLKYMENKEKQIEMKMKKVGVTTLIDFLAKTNQSWKEESGRFNRRYNFNNNGNQKSRQHDSYIALHDALYNILGFTFVNKEVHLKDENTKVIHNSEVKYIHGYVDMLLKRSDGRYAILDIKTTKCKTVTLMNAVTKQKNELQLRLYAYLLKRAYNLDYTPSCYVCGIRLKDKNIDIKNVNLRQERSGDLVIWEVPINDKDLISLDNLFSIWEKNYSKPKIPTEF